MKEGLYMVERSDKKGLSKETLRAMAAKKTVLTYKVLYMSDNPLYILTPKKRLLCYLCIIFFIWTALLSLTFTFNFTLIVTPPLIALAGYIFFLFFHVWNSHKYSCIYPLTLFVLSFPIAFLCKFLAYKY